MANHQVNVEYLIEWKTEATSEFASSYGVGVNKRLIADLLGNFKVISHGQIVLTTTDPKLAVKKYNEL